MSTVLILGFQHETNTFSPNKTQWAHFVAADSWPGYLEGDDLFTLQQQNIPSAGFIQAMRDRHTLIPLQWCAATPSGPVTDHAFEQFATTLLEKIKNIDKPFDAIYCDLHGAMVTESQLDAEGELLKRIRAIIPSNTYLVASLDLHANVSQAMFDCCDYIEAYQTYPHVDMAQTGQRLADTLDYYLKKGCKPNKRFHHFNYLIPMIAQSSMKEPARSFYQAIGAYGESPANRASFCPGFPLADTPNSLPSLLVYGECEETVIDQYTQLRTRIEQAKSQFKTQRYNEKDAITMANQYSDHHQWPVLLIDTQDNPGCGGSGDTTGLLSHLLATGTQHCLIFSMADPDSVKTLIDTPLGQTTTIKLGANKSAALCKPIPCYATVIQHSHGQVPATGPFYDGCTLDYGPSVHVKINEIDVIISSHAIQSADLALIEHFNLDPQSFAIIVLKSSVHFLAAFQPISQQIIYVESPGFNTADLNQLNYQHLPPSIDRL